ncbi:MAG: hypothetical protein ABI561_29620, partial [Bradyrhizobium sp.]
CIYEGKRNAKLRADHAARMRSRVPTYQRHFERSEAIHLATQRKNGLLRCARNDDPNQLYPQV